MAGIPPTVRNVGAIALGTVLLAGGFTSGAGAITGSDRSTTQRAIMGAVGAATAGVGLLAIGSGGRGLPQGPGTAMARLGTIIAGLGGAVGAVSIDG